MFAAYGRNTAASAKPYVPAPKPHEHHVDLIELRRRREEEKKTAKSKASALLTEQRRIAREAIVKGREAARRYRENEMSMYAAGESRRDFMSYDKIEKRICKAVGVSKVEVRSNRRDRKLVFARQAVMYWCCRLTPLSLPQIGRRMGRDHTSIMHGRDAYVTKREKQNRHLRVVR